MAHCLLTISTINAITTKEEKGQAVLELGADEVIVSENKE